MIKLKLGVSLPILIISIIYSIFIQAGFLGFGIDVHESYQYSESWPWGFEPVGWLIASLTFNLFEFRFFVGSAATSFLLSLGLNSFIVKILERRFGFYFSLLLGLLLLFSHPIILSGTNILRQGVALSFFFFFLVEYLRGNVKSAMILSIFSILSHNSIAIIFMSFYVYELIKGVRPFIKFFLLLVYVVFVHMIAGMIMSFKSSVETGLDYKPILIALTSVSFLLFVVFFKNYSLRTLSVNEIKLKYIILINLFVVLGYSSSPSAMQRFLIILFIPVIVFMFLSIPVKNGVKLLGMILSFLLWAYMTLSSGAVKELAPL